MNPCGMAIIWAECCRLLPRIRLSMRAFVVLLSCVALAFSFELKAEDSPPASTTLPGPQEKSSDLSEPALPAPESNAETAAPGLLPESSELPEHVPAPRPASLQAAVPKQKSGLQEDRHFEDIRRQAMKNPRAVYLLKRAERTSSSSSRRSYMRAYYANVSQRMRELDPALKSSINAYEEARTRELSQGKSQVHRSQLAHHKPTGRSRYAVHHIHPRHHRYWHPVYDEDPYEPVYYGPPVVFYPW
jgi:hypothetical protein